MSGGPNSWNWAGIEDLVGHMQGMVNRGLIDGTICADLEKVFGTPAGPEKVKT